MASEPLKTAISGSFKFKPEIDALHDEFADYDVIVLAPDKGWLWLPKFLIVPPPPFRPLPSERGMTIREIENRFLEFVDQADFLYVCNPQSYLGLSASFEIGYALGHKKPIYAQAEVDFLELADGDLGLKTLLESRIVIAGTADAVQLERARREASLEDLAG